MANPRKIAFDILLKIQKDGAYSSLLLQNTVRERKLSGLDSSFVFALVYGVLERLITLDFIIKKYSKIPLKKIEQKTLTVLRMGLYQILYMDKVPDSAAVNESVKLAKNLRLTHSAGYINGILRSFLRNDKKFDLPDDAHRSLHYSVEYSCPREIIDIWLSAYGEENTVGILKSAFDRPPLYAGVNTLKISPDDLVNELEREGVKAGKTAFLQTCLSLENTGPVEELSAFKKGLFYIQDMSSQLCVKFANAKPRQIVIDACSAPGGKAFGMALDMENRGRVFAFDMYDHKIKLVKDGAKRLGITVLNVSVRNSETDKSELPLADRVLCDVPCSGLGIIRRKPEIRYKSNVTDNNLPEIQYEILRNNSRYVAFGGLLIYSTCTLNPGENAEVADRFLKENPDFEPYPIKLPEGLKRGIDEKENQLTLFPHINNTDGFFVSMFRKRGN